MKLCRFKMEAEGQIAVMSDNQWYVIDPLLASLPDERSVLDVLVHWHELKASVEAALQAGQLALVSCDAQPCLPFQPLSLRDLMLSESHAVNAARGFVGRYMPKLLPLIRLYERTGRVFPALKPKPIWYRQPIYYFSSHTNLVTDGQPVHWPSFSKDLDYELELAFVLSKPLYNATHDQALDAIGGFLVLNDFSARDVQLEEMRSGFGPQKSKHFVNGLSSIVATADDILPRVNSLSAQVKINGSQVVETSTANMQHSLADVLVHVSRSERLYPGEVFGLGTMAGGCAMENGHWLQSGDEICLSIDGVGSLTNTIE